MLTKFLDPKNDFTFKKIFGVEETSDKDLERLVEHDPIIERAYERVGSIPLE